MPVPASLASLSTTPASNQPSGSENPFPELDDHLRASYSFHAQNRDAIATKLNSSAASAFGLTLIDDANAAAARATLGAASAGANTFTGAQTLPGDAVNPLEAVPLQQAQSLASAAALPQIQNIAYSLAANTLSLYLTPTVLDFRNTVLTTGAPVRRTLGNQINLVIPAGATLGTANGVAARLLLLAIDNNGTIELAVVNAAGGLNLDETGLISTTAISAGATAANVIYAATARGGVAFRVVGFIDFTQATAGTYVTHPTLVQGAGGLALSGFANRTYVDLTASRALGTTYYNTTGREIAVIASTSGGGASGAPSTLTGYVNGVAIKPISGQDQNGGGFNPYAMAVEISVPANASYSVGAYLPGGGGLVKWFEYR